MSRSEPALLLLSYLAFVFSASAQAAPCCSSRSAAPSIISGDDQARLTLTTSQSTVIGDAPDQGLAVFRSGQVSETTQLFRLDGAILISDRFQAGMGVPLVRREIEAPGSQASAARLGDMSLSAAYEALPEWSYSPWKPKGFVFAQLVFPTGRSLYEARTPKAVDASGRGFYSLASGALFTKSWNAWDAFVLPELHYSFARTFDEGSGSGSELTALRVAPGFGGSLALGAGFSPEGGSLRYGIRLQSSFESGKHLRSESAESASGAQQSWTVSLDWSYLASVDWSLMASYSDQTLLGPARNATLSRTFLLSLQRSWQR